MLVEIIAELLIANKKRMIDSTQEQGPWEYSECHILLWPVLLVSGHCQHSVPWTLWPIGKKGADPRELLFSWGLHCS